MRPIFIAAIALGALALSPAAAQQDHHPGSSVHNGAHAGPSHGAGPAHGGPAMHRPALSTVHHSTARVVTEHRNTTVYRAHTHHVTTVHRVTTGHRALVTRHVTVRRNLHEASAHRTVEARALRRNFTAPRRFHHGAYVRPAGWYPHRWAYGERLPGGWYGRSYWIVNVSLFGLVYPPDGYEWIRVGDDAVLVDIDTGEIIRVEYAVFF